jgi:hypothetical protein
MSAKKGQEASGLSASGGLSVLLPQLIRMTSTHIVVVSCYIIKSYIIDIDIIDIYPHRITFKEPPILFHAMSIFPPFPTCSSI